MTRGHNIYKRIWTPVIREEPVLEAEDRNKYDDQAVAVMKDGQVVWHVPRSIGKLLVHVNVERCHDPRW